MSVTDRTGDAGFFERQMATYATYHTNARNRLTHFIGIPAIVFSIMLVVRRQHLWRRFDVLI